MAAELRERNRTLSHAARALATEPSAETLHGARDALQGALVAWKRAYTFRSGPFASSHAFPNASFWPAREAAIDAVLLAPEPIDEARIEALPADARGIYALEYLLFDRSKAGSLSAAGAVNGRDYVSRLAANVAGYAERVDHLLGDGAAFADAFAGAGPRSVGGLAAQCLDTLDITLGKLTRLSRARSERTPLESAIEGYYSGSSLHVVRALVGGTERLYMGAAGGGLKDLVAAASPPIDAHVRQAFADATSCWAALSSPLELAIDADAQRFQAAAAALATLRHVVATEMLSALEV